MFLSVETKFMTKERVGELHLLACVVCFGISFVIQRLAATNPNRRSIIGPLTYNALRYVVSTLVTFFMMPTLRRAEEREKDKLDPAIAGANKGDPKDPYSPTFYLWLYGGISGIAGFFGSNGQQVGLMHVSVAKTAFITSMFVIVIPVVESLLPGGHMAHSTWIAAAVSIVGTYFVSGMAESGAGSSDWSETHGVSELIIFVSMLFWAVSIMVCDRGCKKCNCMVLTSIDFLVVTVLSLLAAFVFESHEWVYPFTRIRLNIINIITVGTTEAAGFLFCALGQIVVSSSRTALILSLEALSGAFFGYLFLNETLTPLEMLGCLIMSSAFVVSSEEWDIADLQRVLTAHWAHWWYSGSLGPSKTSAVFSYELIEAGVEKGGTALETSAAVAPGGGTPIKGSIVNTGSSSSRAMAGASAGASRFVAGTGSSSSRVVPSVTSSLRGVDIPTLLGYSIDSVAEKHH